MPCDSSYMEANDREISLSRVCCLLEEIDTGKAVDTSSGAWRGYHPKAYNKGLSKHQADALVAKLCSKLSTLNPKNYSLEMQTWWRDHLRADEERERQEKQKAEEERAKKDALTKLSAKERKVLGV